MGKTLPPERPPSGAEWQALLARAPGTLVCALRTTGICCRAGCPAHIHNRENVSLFDSRAAAVRVGFRPCKRCWGS